MDAASPAPGTLAAIWMGATAGTGLLLVLFGGRLLLLMVTLAGGAAGWLAGGALCNSVVPEWPPALCAATCAVLGAGVAALFLKPTIALIMALVGASAGLLVAGALIERGMVPTGRAPYGSLRSAAVEPTAARGVRDARSSALAAIERALSGQPAGAATASTEPEPGTAAPPSAGASPSPADSGSLVTLARAGMQVWRELVAAWESVPPQARTLLAASAGAGAAAGLVLGLLFSRWAMSGVSALVGAGLLCGAGLPLAERISGGAVRAPESPTGWLLLVAAIAVSGWAFEAWRRSAAASAAADAPPA
jgi:hypothetical protein